MRDILHQHGAWEEKRNLINEMGIESVDDLRCMFTSASEADAHGLRRQWLLVHQKGAQTLERACRVKSMERRQVITRPVFTLKVKRHKFCKGHKALNPAEDNTARRAMARRAVGLSLEWAPLAGLFDQDPQPSERTVERAIDRVVKYESKVVAAALNTWCRWTSWCKESKPKVAVMSMDVNSWEDFIHGSSDAATMARSQWFHCKWLVTQLKAPIPPTPAKKSDKTGGIIVEDVQTPHSRSRAFGLL